MPGFGLFAPRKWILNFCFHFNLLENRSKDATIGSSDCREGGKPPGFFSASNIIDIFQTASLSWVSLIWVALVLSPSNWLISEVTRNFSFAQHLLPIFQVLTTSDMLVAPLIWSCWNNLQDLWEQSPRFVGIWARKKSPRFVGIISKICGNVGEKKKSPRFVGEIF